MPISAGRSASREGCRRRRPRGWAPTSSQRCVSTTGLPIAARRKPLGTSWPWTRTAGRHRGQVPALCCLPTAPLACPRPPSPPVRSTVSAMWAGGLGSGQSKYGGKWKSWGAPPQGQQPRKPLSILLRLQLYSHCLSTPPLSTPLTTQLHPLPSLRATAFTPTPLDFGYCNSFLIKPTQFLSAQFNSTQSSSTHYNLSFI